MTIGFRDAVFKSFDAFIAHQEDWLAKLRAASILRHPG